MRPYFFGQTGGGSTIVALSGTANFSDRESRFYTKSPDFCGALFQKAAKDSKNVCEIQVIFLRIFLSKLSDNRANVWTAVFIVFNFGIKFGHSPCIRKIP